MLRLPAESIIPADKITKYPLVRRPHGDESLWLRGAGYSLDTAELLDADLRAQMLPLDAKATGSDKFGDYFETLGTLRGPAGNSLVLSEQRLAAYLHTREAA